MARVNLEDIVYLVIALILVATLFPVGTSMLAAATWGSTNPAVISILTIAVPVVAGIVVILAFVGIISGRAA